MILNKIKLQNKYFKDSNRILFICFPGLIIITLLLIFKIKIGLFISVGTLLFLTVLIKPKFIYYLLISLFSIEGYDALPGASYAKLIGILLVIGLIMRIAITKEAVPKDNLYKYFFLFFVGSIVSFVFAKDLLFSLKMYITYISLFFLYILTRYFIRDIKDIYTSLNYLFFSTIITFAFIQIMDLSVYFSDTRVSGGVGDSNEYASYILVLIPLALYMAMSSSGVSRFLYVGCLTSFLVLFVFTFSRGGMLGFLGLIGILIYHYSFGRMRQILFFVFIIAVISYFIVPVDFWIRASTIIHPEQEQGHSISTRVANYKAALKMFLNYPLAGVGLSNFRFNCENYAGVEGAAVHNTYLEILTGGGLLSFIPFSFVLITCWRKLKIKKNHDNNMHNLFICLKASFVSILITSFFFSGDHKKTLWFLFALISSAYYIAKAEKRLDIT